MSNINNIFSGITRTTKTLEMNIFESTEDMYGNTGAIVFTVTEVTDVHTQLDGTQVTKVYNRYTKNDGRRFTDHGRAYFTYDNESKFKAAIARTRRGAAANNLGQMTTEKY